MQQVYSYIIVKYPPHPCIIKAEHEIQDAYLMQNLVDVRQGGHARRRFHQHSDLLSYPERWDWREKGFVTDVSNDIAVHDGYNIIIHLWVSYNVLEHACMSFYGTPYVNKKLLT